MRLISIGLAVLFLKASAQDTSSIKIIYSSPFRIEKPYESFLGKHVARGVYSVGFQKVRKSGIGYNLNIQYGSREFREQVGRFSIPDYSVKMQDFVAMGGPVFMPRILDRRFFAVAELNGVYRNNRVDFGKMFNQLFHQGKLEYWSLAAQAKIGFFLLVKKRLQLGYLAWFEQPLITRTSARKDPHTIIPSMRWSIAELFIGWRL